MTFDKHYLLALFIHNFKEQTSIMFGGLFQAKERTYEDLKNIEAKRRKLLKTAKNITRFKMIFAFSETLLPEVLTSRSFATVFILYIVIRILIVQEIVKQEAWFVVTSSSIAMIGGFLSFFLVFFANQSYTRFTTLYGNSMSMEGRIFNVALLARTNLPTNEAWRLMRYLNAAHLLGYVGLSEVYSETNFFDPMNENLQLLTESETARVKEIGVDSGGSGYRELIGWCLEIIYHHFHADLLDLNTMDRMVAEVLTLRGHIGGLYDYDDQPIPFVYVHLLTMLVDIYMPLLAYANATSVGNDVQGVIITFLAAIYTLGLVAIGRALSDPYGTFSPPFYPL